MIDDIFDINKKNIVLTGSSGFLGTHFSHILSSHGANVILIDVEKNKNKKLELELTKKYNTTPKAFSTDISDPKEMSQLVKNILKKFRTIDVLINNAQFLPKTDRMRDASFEKYPFELWNKNFLITGFGRVGKVLIKRCFLSNCQYIVSICLTNI